MDPSSAPGKMPCAKNHPRGIRGLQRILEATPGTRYQIILRGLNRTINRVVSLTMYTIFVRDIPLDIPVISKLIDKRRFYYIQREHIEDFSYISLITFITSLHAN